MTFYGQQLQAGRVPIWNERANLGFPLLAQGRAGVFYPLHLFLYRVLQPSAAYQVSLPIHLALASVFAFACARGFGIGRAGAVLTGVVYAGQGFFVGHLTQPWSYTTGCWLPLFLLAAWRWLEYEDWRWLVGLSVIFAVLLLAGHFQLAVYALLTLCVICLGSGFSKGRGSATIALRLMFIMFAITGGAALAAIQLVPTAELCVVADWRGRGQEYVSSFAFPLLQIVNYLTPSFLMTNSVWENTTWAAWRSSYAESLVYVGLLPLGLAIRTMCVSHRERTVRFMMAILVFALLASIFPRVPVLSAINDQPGFGWFTAPARWSVISGLALALMAGHGLESIDRNRFVSWFRRFVPVALIVLVVLVVVVCYETANNGTTKPGSQNASTPISFGTLAKELAFPLINMVFVLGFTTRLGKGATQRISLTTFILGWTIVDLGAAIHICGRARYEPNESIEQKSPFLKMVADETQGRIWGSSMDLPLLVGAQPMANQSAPDMKQYWDPQHEVRRRWWMGSFATIPVPDRWEDRALHVGRITSMFDTNDVEFMRLTDIRYLTHGLDGDGPLQEKSLDKLKSVSDPWLSSQFLDLSTEPTSDQELWTLWTLKPKITSARAWLFPVTDPPEPGTDPRLITQEPPARRGLLDSAFEVDDVSDEGEKITIRGSAESAAVVVLSDLFYPGWTATLRQKDVDRTVSVERAFGRMRGTYVDQSGDFEIVFSYEPESFRVGARISAVACGVWLCCCLLVIVAQITRNRADPTTGKPSQSPPH